MFAVLGRMDRQQRRMSVTRHIQTDLAILPGKRKDSLYEHREEMLLLRAHNSNVHSREGKK